MTPILLANFWYEQPVAWGTIIGAIALLLLVPRSTPVNRAVGGVLAAIAGGCYLASALTAAQDPSHDAVEWVIFGLMAGVTVGSAVAMISSRNSVYSAIWFALTLLGTGGLFLYQGAEFLGVATVVVYAGAIVVTFLFVIMLAQPDGHASYDRISWGWFAKPAAIVSGAFVLGALVYSLQGAMVGGVRERVTEAAEQLAVADATFPLKPEQVASATFDSTGRVLTVQLRSDAAEVQLTGEQTQSLANAVKERLQATAKADPPPAIEPFVVQFAPALSQPRDLLANDHMAHLGGFLFSRHLITIEIGGTLLLAALVGAVAMLSQSPGARRERDAHV